MRITVTLALTLTCPRCGEEFASAIQMDEPTWAKIRLDANIERCSNCGYSKRYEKADYFFA
jgi:transcription elongation factor Elf1